MNAIIRTRVNRSVTIRIFELLISKFDSITQIIILAMKTICCVIAINERLTIKIHMYPMWYGAAQQHVHSMLWKCKLFISSLLLKITDTWPFWIWMNVCRSNIYHRNQMFVQMLVHILRMCEFPFSWQLANAWFLLRILKHSLTVSVRQIVWCQTNNS